MWYNRIKTAALLAALSGLFLLIGVYFGGTEGLTIAFIMALVMNGIAYFFSDSIVLNMYGAKKLDPNTYPEIYEIVKELAHKSNIPMPKLYIINTNMANAFATGRNPQHASVAVTTGILNLLDKRELRGVLAHELSHVKNRDILVSTVAAVLATAVGYLANMAYYSALLGGGRNGSRRNPIGSILIAILMPMAASLIRLAISRSREYLADEKGAEISDDPLALASALEKLHSSTKRAHLDPQNAEHATTAHLFIVNPFSMQGLIALFSTHPPVEARIKKLYNMSREKL